MESCSHSWASYAGEQYKSRHCTECSLKQKASLKVTWTDDGVDENTLQRLEERKRVKPKGVLMQGDGYSGWNEGMGMYIRSKSHYQEEVKKRGIVERG